MLGRWCFRGSHNLISIIARRTARSQGVRDAVTSPNNWRRTLIIGMGVDIAEVERIQRAIERYGEVFLKRVYTVRERGYCEGFKNKYERYAGRFAVKEAAMKALGTGWRREIGRASCRERV